MKTKTRGNKNLFISPGCFFNKRFLGVFLFFFALFPVIKPKTSSANTNKFFPNAKILAKSKITNYPSFEKFSFLGFAIDTLTLLPSISFPFKFSIA